MTTTTIQPVGLGELVAGRLRAHLPGPEILTPEQRLGSPDKAAGQTLHVEPDGSFSITAVVWRPGQITPIHDHTPGASSASSRASSTRRSSTATST